MTIKDEIGNTYNRLTVVSRAENTKAQCVQWLCKCSCGVLTKVTAALLRSGHTKSCGCLQKENSANRLTSHNMSRSSTYGIHRAVLTRCYSSTHNKYPNYGGRGITVCDRWREPAPQGFLNFLEDMGERPEGMSIDRVDNNLGYSKENCRWVDSSTQSYNQRRSKRNSSGVVGVKWWKTREVWVAEIHHQGERIHIGYFNDFDLAVTARKEAEIKYYGHYRDNETD